MYRHKSGNKGGVVYCAIRERGVQVGGNLSHLHGWWVGGAGSLCTMAVCLNSLRASDRVGDRRCAWMV